MPGMRYPAAKRCTAPCRVTVPGKIPEPQARMICAKKLAQPSEHAGRSYLRHGEGRAYLCRRVMYARYLL